MKKIGNFTSEASKVLKSADRIACHVADDGMIYVTNAYAVYKMTTQEYAAIVRPVACCDAGNWSIFKDGQREESKLDLVKFFNEAVSAVSDSDTLKRCPLNLDTGKTAAACYYNSSRDFSAFYNAKFIASLRSDAVLCAPSAKSSAVAHIGGEPFAVILPIRPEADASRSIRAYFTDPSKGDKPSRLADELSAKLTAASNESGKLRADLTTAQNELSKSNALIAQLQEQLAQQAAELAAMREAQRLAEQAPAQNTQPAQVEAPATSTEPKTAAELIAARFSNMAGVTATIKGAQTAAPVVWLSGDTEKHADAIRAAGAKWSHKRSAFYVRVA